MKELVAESYPRIATDLLNPLLELLRLSRDLCGGDIDKFLLILVVALRTTIHPEFSCRTPGELISGEIPVFPGFGTNIRSIADSIQIPRETARRKVGELVDAGWLISCESRLYFTAKAYQDLAPVREHIERLALRNFQTLTSLVREAGAIEADR